MATVTVKENIKTPVIVISGDHGTGKSYINKLVKKYINSVASINKYDFLTRKLLYICNIHPLQIGYVLLTTDLIDRELFKNNDNINYLRNKVINTGNLSVDDMKYFIEHVLLIDLNALPNLDVSIGEITSSLNGIMSTKNKSSLRGELYNTTIMLFNAAILPVFQLNNQDMVNRYLDSRMNEYRAIFERFKYRLVYYAYSVEEVNYFKEKYAATNIFISMQHNLQSQLLLADKKYDKVDEIVTSSRKDQVEKMRKAADIVVTNDLEVHGKILNKIMSSLNI